MSSLIAIAPTVLQAYLIQPTLWKSTKSNVHMMMRSWLGGGGYIYRCFLFPSR